MLSILHILWAIPIYLLYKVFGQLNWSLQNSRKARNLGCRPGTQWRSRDPLGILDLYAISKAADEGREIDYFMECFDEVRQRAGDPNIQTVEGKFMRVPFFITLDPKNIQAMLATQFKEFDLGEMRHGTFAPLLGSGIFSSDGKQWEHARALLRPQFSRGQISNLELEENHVQDLLQALQVNMHKGWTDTVDLMPLFYRLTLDSATEFLFGESVGTQLAALKGNNADFQRHADFAHAFDFSQDCISKAMRLGDFYQWGITKQYKDYCKEVHAYIDSFVQKALAPQEKKRDGKYVFLEQLAMATQDPVEIRDQLLSILVAGRDTTAGMLSFLFLELATRPDVFNKLRAVIVEHFGTEKENITFETLKSCQYLQWCLNETLRLYPSVPWNARRSVVDTTLPRGGGPNGQSPLFIPKGTEVNYMIYGTHRLPEYWGSDAKEYRPERWDGRKPGFDFLPFNGGPRICLGQQFALTQSAYVTVRLLQHFDAMDGSAHAGQPIKWTLTLTGKPRNGVKLRLHKADAQ